MRTYSLRDEQSGALYAIEVDYMLIGIRQLRKLLATSPHVSHLRARRPFSRAGDVRLRFRYKGTPYVVTEPFGDNSRFWIGPENDTADDADGLLEVQRLLQGYRPNLIRRLFADLWSMRWMTRRGD